MITAALAILVGLLCWLLFWIKDRRRKPHEGDKPVPVRQKDNFPLSRPVRLPEASLLTDYTVYRLSFHERAAAFAAGGIAFAGIGYLFYAHVFAVAGGFLCGAFYPKVRARVLRERRLQTLRMQFKQTLQAVSGSLGAGRSVEQAYADAVGDMKLLYPEGTSLMIEELEIMLRKLQNGETIEASISDFSLRSGVEEAMQFAEIFTVSKRTGGNLIEIVRRTSTIISEKLEIEQDIAVLLAQKKFESRVLLAAPLFIVGVLKATASDYMASLYTGAGRLTMTAALVLLSGCFWLTKRLMDVRI